MRHTSATLSLMAGVPIHVVSEKLGHASTTITWSTYVHVLPSEQTDASTKLAALLHG
jgi:integrase